MSHCNTEVCQKNVNVRELPRGGGHDEVLN